MAETALTQAEATDLIGVEKKRTDVTPYPYPGIGGSINIPLTSLDNKEHFLLDIGRGYINLSKVTHQLRARVTIVLVRLDVDGAPHRNPDGEMVPCPHLHIYREGFGTKWAYPVTTSDFTNTADSWITLADVMRYCNVTLPPLIQRGMFT